MQPIRVILASGSPHRLALLETAGFKVQVVRPHVVEPDLAGFALLDAGLRYLALLKAESVRQQGHSGLILAADTVGLVNGQPFGKPADRAEAARMLAAISGTTHAVLTGWCLLRGSDGLALCGVERTGITMRPWSTAERAAYLDSEEWIGKSGAYGLQPDDPFVTHMEGSRSNVIGIPVERILAVLNQWTDFTS